METLTGWTGSGGHAPRFPVFKLENDDWKDGLIVRTPNWLGDAVMALPALVQLRRTLPRNCALFVLTVPQLQDFYNSIPMVDLTVSLHRAHALWNRRDINAVRALRAGCAAMLNNSLRDALFFRLAGVRKLFGAAARGRGFLLTRSYQFPKRRDFVLNNLHHADRYLSIAYAMGAPEWDGAMPEFSICKERELASPEVIRVLETPKIMTLAPGAAYGEAKRWPAENFRAVAKSWIDAGGSVVIVGSAGERPIGESVAEGLPTDGVFNMAGKTDLCELMMMLQKADICVANDSGVMHLAAALGRPGVAVFGSTDPSSTSPVGKNWRILHEKMDCSPCFKRVCPLESGQYKCMRTAGPADVEREIRALLGGSF